MQYIREINYEFIAVSHV